MPPQRSEHSHRPLTKAALRTKWGRRAQATLVLAAVLDPPAEPDDELELFLLAALAQELAKGYKDLGRGPQGEYNAPSAGDFFQKLLHKCTERRFRRWLWYACVPMHRFVEPSTNVVFFRMDRKSFWAIVELIKDDRVFQSHGHRPQRPVKHQLAVHLIHVGRELAGKSSNVTAIAEGTLYLYMDRVSKAICRQKRLHLKWPSRRRKRFIRSQMAVKGFSGCIGVADGTLIRLATKPMVDGESYRCRKKMYGVSHRYSMLSRVPMLMTL
jgi:hypothetical protein